MTALSSCYSVKTMLVNPVARQHLQVFRRRTDIENVIAQILRSGNCHNVCHDEWVETLLILKKDALPDLSNSKVIKLLRMLSWNFSLDFSDSSVSLLCLAALGCTGICLQVMRACATLQHHNRCSQVSVPLQHTKEDCKPSQVKLTSSSCGLRLKLRKTTQNSAALIHRHLHELFFVIGVTSVKPDLKYTSHQSQGRKFSAGGLLILPELSALSTAPGTASFLDKWLRCESQVKHCQLVNGH